MLTLDRRVVNRLGVKRGRLFQYTCVALRRATLRVCIIIIEAIIEWVPGRTVNR